MKKTVAEFKSYFAGKIGSASFDKVSAPKQAIFLDGLQMIYEKAWYSGPYSFAKDTMKFTTEPVYSVGTASGTAGEFYVSISTSIASVSNSKSLRGAYLKIGNLLYKIKRADTTNDRFVLETALTGDIASGSSYSIYFIDYPLRWDVGRIRDGAVNDEVLSFIPESLLDRCVEEGTPEILFSNGFTEEDFASVTGTLSNGDDEITSTSGLTLTQDLIGKSIIVSGQSEINYIRDVDNANTKIYLENKYKGTSVTGGTFIIEPKGTPLIGMSPIPSQRKVVKINYTFIPNSLKEDADMTLLPNDLPIMAGLDLMATKWETVGEKGFINETLFNDKKFQQSLDVLKFSRAKPQQRMYNVYDYKSRSYNRASLYGGSFRA